MCWLRELMNICKCVGKLFSSHNLTIGSIRITPSALRNQVFAYFTCALGIELSLIKYALCE